MFVFRQKFEAFERISGRRIRISEKKKWLKCWRHSLIARFPARRLTLSIMPRFWWNSKAENHSNWKRFAGGSFWTRTPNLFPVRPFLTSEFQPTSFTYDSIWSRSINGPRVSFLISANYKSELGFGIWALISMLTSSYQFLLRSPLIIFKASNSLSLLEEIPLQRSWLFEFSVGSSFPSSFFLVPKYRTNFSLRIFLFSYAYVL